MRKLSLLLVLSVVLTVSAMADPGDGHGGGLTANPPAPTKTEIVTMELVKTALRFIGIVC